MEDRKDTRYRATHSMLQMDEEVQQVRKLR